MRGPQKEASVGCFFTDGKCNAHPSNLHRPATILWKPWSCSIMGLPRRHLWLLISSVTVFLYVMLGFNSYVWNSLNGNSKLIGDDLSGYGFRKLLEDGDDRLHTEKMEQRFPQCIIIGVRKCGTRALLEFLGLHSQVRTAEIETHFFNNDENYEKGYSWYQKYMPYSFADQITIEKTPRYFISDSAPERINKLNATVKLIVIFRNPTVRVISDYTQVYQNKIRRNKTIERFEDTVIDADTGRVNTAYKAVRISMYYYYLTHWLRYFKLHQIHIVNGDILIKDPLHEIRKIETFLGLDHRITENNVYFNETRGFYCMQQGTSQHCLGATKGRKHPHIDPKIIEKLNRFYRPYNRKLFSMIEQELDWD